MDQATHNKIVSFLWGIADELRDTDPATTDPTDEPIDEEAVIE